MVRESVLIVDDSLDILELIQRNLSAQKFHTYQASNVTDAIQVLKTAQVDLLITDLQMPVANGMHLINFCRQHYPKIPILVITGYPSVAGAVEVIKAGAVDYLTKPFTSQELIDAVNKSLNSISSKVQKIKSKNKPTLIGKFGIIGSSDALLELDEMISRIKNHKVTVLVQGESGTGKELIARAIHYSSKFAKAPFIAVNCGAIPESLLESELFGYIKGAFTGADSTRAGFFQAADGGTIFLDEIGNAPLKVQTRLLRVLQEKEITMVGATKAQKINVRIIAATNAKLQRMVNTEQFREDLYYRLNVISIEAPPLRKRKDDIAQLTQYFISKYSIEFNKDINKVDDLVLHLFRQYDWPGNIRELENLCQRLILMATNTITANLLPAYFNIAEKKIKTTDFTLQTLKKVEIQHINRVLEYTEGNKSKAAKILGVDRKTLRLKLEQQ